MNERRRKSLFKLIICTTIGFFYYLVPFKIGDQINMAVPLIKGIILDHVTFVDLIVVWLMVIFALISIYCSLRNKKQIGNDYFRSLFVVSPVSLFLRFLGAVVAVMAFYKLGPEYVWGSDTGEIVAFFLMPSLFIVFFFALLMLPLLTDFGGMELLGGIFQPLFKPLFGLRSASSVFPFICWVGPGTPGIVMVDKEHERNHITTKESYTIIFGFAVISFPVTMVYSTEIAGLDVVLFPYLVLTLVVIGIITTVVMVRIPPLYKKADLFMNKEAPEDTKPVKGNFKAAIEKAVAKTEQAPGGAEIIKMGIMSSLNIYVHVFPLIFLIATCVLAISEYTNILSWIALPIAPVLDAIGLPESDMAAPCMIIGFADTLLPFLSASNISSQLTVFVVCAVAIYQGYCMSEGGVILLKSSMKVKFRELVVFFTYKTIFAIPIAYIMGLLIGLK